MWTCTALQGARWLSGREFDLWLKGIGVETHWRQCVESFSKTFYPHATCTKILTKIHPNYRWITGETDMEFQFSSWNWQGDGILAKIQVGLPKDSMWIFSDSSWKLSSTWNFFLRIYPPGIFPNSTWKLLRTRNLRTYKISFNQYFFLGWIFFLSSYIETDFFSVQTWNFF